MRIVFNRSDNAVSVIAPSPEWIASGRTTDELAKKCVPIGLKYKIVEDSVIPTDRSFRNAWEVDEEELTDGKGEQE